MKKLLATLLASTMALSAMGGLVACGGEGSGDDPNTITVWAPENSHGSEEEETGYKGMIAGWKEAYPEYAHYNVRFVAKAESDVNSSLGNNPAAGAEVFFFASDHYRDLVHNKGLQPLTDEYVQQIKARDEEFTYEFVTDDEDKMWAFPTTNDNGYFLWYNDEYLSEDDVKDLDSLIAACNAQNVHFSFPYGVSWYAASFMMGMGCKFNYDDEDHYICDANTPAAKGAAKAMFKYANSANNIDGVKDTKGKKTDVIVSVEDPSAGLADGTIGVAMSYASRYTDIEKAYRNKYTSTATGTVDEEKLEEALSHLKATVLPTFKATVDGTTEEKTYHMGTFYGGKYCGVNRSKSEAKIVASLSLANWFTKEEGQKVRFEADGAGPSNKNAATLENVQKSIGIQAYKAQVALGDETNCIQGAQKGTFWDNINKFSEGVFERKVDAGSEVDYTTEIGMLAQLAKIAADIGN
ncbi:MAG: extracellular solute-binding protein [Clostridiales bacterium]|nr:extracellular solute-binding protein [Clostridiales bacterium]